MLQSIHDKLKGWLAGVVLGIIALVFVFWGINWTMSAPTYAAKVNGSEISSNEVRQAYQRQLAQVARQSNGQVDEAQRNAVKQQVLDQFVNTEAVVTRADALGYRVSDQDVLNEMGKVPAFQVDGKFDKNHAMAVMRAQGRSIADIEEIFRREVKLRQLDEALTLTSFVTPSEVKRLGALEREERQVSWFTLSPGKFSAEASPSDADIQGYYDAHRSQYMTPETVDLRYVELSMDQLQSKVTVDEAQLKSYYEEQKAKTPERFTQPEQRRVSHILLQVADPKEDAAAKAKAEDVLKRAQGGEDFATLAKQYSQDTGSAQQGGDLGWSERKAWVTPFGDAAYGMKEGEITGPVKTQFGYHILKLVGIRPVAVKTFEDAKSDLETEYRRGEAERLFNSAQDQLADAALQSNADLDVVARKAGLKVQDVPGFSRTEGGGELGKSPALLQTAFSQDVLDGRLSSMVEIESGRGVVLHASDHKLPQQKPLDSVRSAVVASWKEQRGAELAATAARDAVKRLTAGEAWDALAKSLGVTPQAPKFVDRGDRTVPPDIGHAIFASPKPAADKPAFQQLPLSDGDSAVLELIAVREKPDADAAQKDALLRRQLTQQAASSEAESYALAARADAKVSLNPQVLD